MIYIVSSSNVGGYGALFGGDNPPCRRDYTVIRSRASVCIGSMAEALSLLCTRTWMAVRRKLQAKQIFVEFVCGLNRMNSFHFCAHLDGCRSQCSTLTP